MAAIQEAKTAASSGVDSDTEDPDANNLDPRLERTLVRKLDMYIIPVYMLTYMFR